MSDPLESRYLEKLREIDDPLLSVVKASIPPSRLANVRDRGLRGVVTPPKDDRLDLDKKVRVIAAAALDRNGCDENRIAPDGERLVRAQHLFARFGNEIAGALLLAALPQTYAAEPGSSVLTATGRLQEDLQRRIRGTAHFLMIVMQAAPGGTESDRQKAAVAMWTPHGDQPKSKTPIPWKMCAALRIYHEAMRQEVRAEAEKPGNERLKQHLELDTKKVLNQEDLLGTLLTFTIAVFEVLEQMGITWSADDKDAYLHAWDVVGLHLGVGDVEVRKQLGSPALPQWQGLRPPTETGSQALLDQIRRRQWVTRQPAEIKDEKWKTARPGRLLVRALVEELELAMPPRTRSWPLALMRYFAPDVVQDRLLLGAPGVILGSMKHLSHRSRAGTSLTCARRRPRIEARIVRMMANEVTRRSMVHFIRESEGQFVIPGLEEWADGFDFTDSFGRG